MNALKLELAAKYDNAQSWYWTAIDNEDVSTAGYWRGYMAALAFAGHRLDEHRRRQSLRRKWLRVRCKITQWTYSHCRAVHGLACWVLGHNGAWCSTTH